MSLQASTFSDELTLLIQSCQNLLYISTHEENRCVNDIEKISNRLTYDCFTWDFVGGLKNDVGSTVTDDNDMPLNDPVSVIEYISNSKRPAVYVLKDFHPFLKESSYPVIRALRNFLNNCDNPNRFIIILSPVKLIPIELQKQIHVLDFAFPTYEQIQTFLRSSYDDVRNHIDVPDQAMEKSCIKSLQGLTMEEIRDVIAYSLVKEGSYSPEVFLSYKKQIIKKDDILEYYETDETMDSIGGLDLLKDWLQVAGLGFSDAAKDFGVDPPRGLLLLGIPGTGKSLTCKVAGKLWNMPVIRFDIGKVMDRLVGSSEARMRSALQLIQSVAPCIMWIDEIEKALSGMGSSNMSDGGTTSRVVGTLLTFLQDRESDVFVIATANSLDTFKSNPELLRAGRFDGIFFSDLPQFSERKEIFSIHLNKRKRNPNNFDLDALAQATNGYTGAEIEQVVKEAIKMAWAKGGGLSDVTTEDIIAAVSEVVPLKKTMGQEIIALQQWAEDRAKRASSLEDKPNIKSNLKIIE